MKSIFKIITNHQKDPFLKQSRLFASLSGINRCYTNDLFSKPLFTDKEDHFKFLEVFSFPILSFIRILLLKRKKSSKKKESILNSYIHS